MSGKLSAELNAGRYATFWMVKIVVGGARQRYPPTQ